MNSSPKRQCDRPYFEHGVVEACTASAVGRGRVSLSADSDAWHAAPFVYTQHSFERHFATAARAVARGPILPSPPPHDGWTPLPNLTTVGALQCLLVRRYVRILSTFRYVLNLASKYRCYDLRCVPAPASLCHSSDSIHPKRKLPTRARAPGKAGNPGCLKVRGRKCVHCIVACPRPRRNSATRLAQPRPHTRHQAPLVGPHLYHASPALGEVPIPPINA